MKKEKLELVVSPLSNPVSIFPEHFTCFWRNKERGEEDREEKGDSSLEKRGKGESGCLHPPCVEFSAQKAGGA